MKINLYIFVTLNNPDIYINVIRYCLRHYDDLSENISFIGIFEDPDKKDDMEIYLKSVIEKIKQQVLNLARGKYLQGEI